MRPNMLYAKVAASVTLIWIVFGMGVPTAQAKAHSSKEIACVEATTPQEMLFKLAPEDYDVLSRIIKCESGWNTGAKNPGSSAGGLAQFIDSTWHSTRDRMGLDQGDKFDWSDNITTFVWLAEADGLHHWDASRDCWQ